MPTIYDVAKLARVSTYTVSSVLNSSAYVSPELKQRVLDAVKVLDYTPNEVARSLQMRRSRTIGMLIPDIANPFYAKVVRGAEDRLKKDGYSLILGNTYNDVQEQARYLSVFRARQADGLLVFVAAGGEEPFRKVIDDAKPVVFVARVPNTLEADVVAADNKKGTRLAVEHLLSRGHTHIGLVVGQLSLSTSSERVTGWKQALRKAGLPAEKRYVALADWTFAGGRAAGLELLSLHPRPTAIFAANFLMMAGVLAAIRECGLRCPQDVDVVASDESEWLDVFNPPITAVVQPSYEMGERAADLLLKRIRDPKREVERVVLDPTLHVRGVHHVIAGAAHVSNSPLTHTTLTSTEPEYGAAIPVELRPGGSRD